MTDEELRELIQGSAAETRTYVDQAIQASAAETRATILEETRGMIAETRSAILDETRGMIAESAAALNTRIDGLANRIDGVETRLERKIDALGVDFRHQLGMAVEHFRSDVELVVERVVLIDQRLSTEMAELRRNHEQLDSRVLVLEAKRSRRR